LPPSGEKITVREAARQRYALHGPDAQALEGALQQAEADLERERKVSEGLRAERDEATQRAQDHRDDMEESLTHIDHALLGFGEVRDWDDDLPTACAQLAVIVDQRKEGMQRLRADLTAACEALGQSPRSDVPLGDLAAGLRREVERIVSSSPSAEVSLRRPLDPNRGGRSAGRGQGHG